MKKKIKIEQTLSEEELMSLKSLVGQTIEGAYVHVEDYKDYDNRKSILSVSFQPRLLLMLSGKYFLFNNEVRLDSHNDMIHKIVVQEYYWNPVDTQWQYDRVLYFLFNIDRIDIYSVYYEYFENNRDNFPIELDNEFMSNRIVSDSLIVFVNSFDEKIAILCDEHYQDSILIWYDTKFIETELLKKTFRDKVTHKFYKRITVDNVGITFL